MPSCVSSLGEAQRVNRRFLPSRWTDQLPGLDSSFPDRKNKSQQNLTGSQEKQGSDEPAVGSSPERR